MRIAGIFLLYVFATSCGEMDSMTPFETYDSFTNSSLSNIFFYNKDEAVIVGGDMWSKGVCLESSDGGDNWSLDSLSNKKLIGMSNDPDKRLFSVGVDGYFFHKKNADSSWEFHKLRDWDVLRDVIKLNNGKFICVGGGGLSSGVIYFIEPDLKTDTVIHSDREFRAIACANDSACYIAGFGHVIRLNSLTKESNLIDVEGDFFVDIQFVNENIAYILGATGLMYKTENGGQHWMRLTPGSVYSSSSKVFRKMRFSTVDKGYRVGDNGIVEYTENGGNSWNPVYLDYSGQFNDVFVISRKVFLISENGDILSFVE